jgi:uncharacterized protein (TIGR03067 family)
MVVAVWTAVSCPAAVCAEDDAVRADLSRFSGAWRIVAIEANGERGDNRREILVNYDVDGNWSLTVDRGAGSRGSVRIDPLAVPKEIDVSITEGDGTGAELRGIYEVGDKTLRICLRGEQGWRPREFQSREGALMLFFERQD